MNTIEEYITEQLEETYGTYIEMEFDVDSNLSTVELYEREEGWGEEVVLKDVPVRVTRREFIDACIDAMAPVKVLVTTRTGRLGGPVVCVSVFGTGRKFRG